MDSYDNRVISNNSIIKQPLEDVKKIENEASNEPNCSVSTVPIANDIALHNEECSKDIFSSEKLCSINKPFIMPNELYISLNSDTSRSSKMHAINDRLDFFSLGCHSTPASPEETDRVRGKHMKKELSSFHSPIIEKKMPFSYSTSFVRTSKSEDHLQKSSLTTVNIDIDDELASSLDTLLDTKHDNMYNELESQENLASSSPIVNCRSESPEEVVPQPVSPSSDRSPSSSETSSPSKISIKVTDIQDTRQDGDQLSESSGSEIIPSESSTTIRRDDSECSECECTSEQISAISSLEDTTDRSHGTNSDLGSPDESLSPGLEISLDEDWFCDHELKDIALDTQDIPHGKIIHRTRQVPSSIELNLTTSVAEHGTLQPSFQSVTVDRSPTSRSSSISVSKAENKCEASVESPSSQCSEDTFGDVSYQELTESYDEESAAAAEVEEEVPQRGESPPTDDESDIESLHSFHYSPKAVDLPSATRLAKRLYNLDGFKKTDVSRHLSKNNEFSKAVAEEYVRFFDFPGDTLDVALRKFLSKFCLIGETQERERVLIHFSKRYLDSNCGSFRSQDAVHTLTCAIMLLNSDLHGENLCRKMVCGEFIENLADLNDGENFPRDILKALYHSIKTNPLEWATDDQSDGKKSNSNSHSSSNEKQNFIGHNPFLEVPNPNCATEYKKGYVMRKSCIDSNGKKTPLGRRSWKMLYATLRDLVLYLHKDEHGFKKNQLYDSLHNSVRIHHSFAEKAVDYTKKQYVFRLHTADQAVYLFQTSDSKELDSWVDTINLVAASLSSPPLASGVGCQRKFQRPLLPVSHTKLNLREQLQDHDTRIVWLEKEYEEHLSRTPDRGLKSRFVHEYVEKETHLQNELTRYRTYAYLLRTRMAQYPELETPLVQTSIGELDEPGPEKVRESNSPNNSPTRVKSQRAVVAPMERLAERTSLRT